MPAPGARFSALIETVAARATLPKRNSGEGSAAKGRPELLIRPLAQVVAKLQIHRPVFLPCEHQRVLRVSDKLCDTVNEIDLLKLRECGKSIEHAV